MEFRVLGPLEAVHEGRQLALGGRQQRALLAALLVNKGEPVSTDRLVEALWPSSPPETATTMVQGYVSRLRKVLAPEVLQTSGGGYVLAAPATDAREFEQLVARAHSEEPAQASTLLEEALALWRGPAFADFRYHDFAQAEIARLEDLRVAAVEDRIEADLGLARHTQLVGELEALVREHPLRERLRRQLMLALYRSGRQAEALEAYQDARHALVEELGIEPGSALQELERAILRHDLALEPPPASEPAPAAAPERKLVTMLFVDLGVLPDETDPERLGDALEQLQAAAAAPIEAAGGRVERGVAEALVATFGAPAAHEDHAERALHSALRVRDELGGEIRIAVETGDVVTGRPGSFVTGAPVSAVTRLIRSAAAGEIVVGERAAAATRGAFEVTTRDDGFTLVRAVADARPRGVRGLGRTFVGRESELDVARATLERALRERSPHVLTVVGDAGVGKTSLVRELRERLAPAEPRWHVARCVPAGRGTTYTPLAEVLGELADAGAQAILGLTLGLDVAGDLHPRAARDRLHEAWVELVAAAAAEAPRVLLVEDAHWAEEPLLDLLVRLARDVRGPLLVLVTGRPELAQHAPWGRGRNATQLWLEPLSDDDAHRMLERLASWLPEETRSLVVARAEGNPFFVEELLQSLIDRGWTTTAADLELAAPDTVHALLAARIDLLELREKTALQAAAVIGRTFDADAVHELAGEADLNVLEERDFIRSRGGGELWFKHALTREVAYASLPRARRAHLHGALAEWLERTRGGTDEDAAMLAHHYAEAARELPDARAPAVQWLRRAAELAVARYAIDDALALYDQTLALTGDDAERIDILIAAGRAEMYVYAPERMRARMEAALALGPTREVEAQIYSQLAYWGLGRSYMWREPPARDVCEHWRTRALELSERGSEPYVYAHLARVFAHPLESEDAAREGLELAIALDDPRLLLYAYEALSLVATSLSRHAEALEWAQRGLEQAPRVGDPDFEAHQSWHAAFVHGRAGVMAPLHAFAATYDRMAASLTPHNEVHAVGLHAVVRSAHGEWQELTQLVPRARAATHANAETPCQFNWRTLLVCALGAAHMGDERQARELEELGRAGAEVVAGPVEREGALLRFALFRGDLGEAERILAHRPVVDPWGLDEHAARLDALAALGHRARVEEEAEPHLRSLGYTTPFAMRALGVVRGDRSLLERAAAEFDAIGLAWRAEETRARL